MPATTVQEWRAKNQPVEVELPSGNVALLRKVNVLDLAVTGDIPSTLVVDAARYKDGGVDMSRLSGDPQLFQQFLGLIDPVVIAAFVQPKVAKEATEDALGISEIDAQDKLAVFAWCNEGAEALRPFRPGPSPRLESAPDGGDVRPPAE